MNKPVVRVWLILAIPLALMLAGVVGGAVRGDYKAVPLVIAALFFSALFFWFSRARLRRMFRDATPDRIIAYYHTTARRVPHANASAAYLSAIAAAAYGQFDRARSELASIDWSAFPPLYQGYRLHALAIITLLEKRDFEGALQLLHEAREVASAGSAESSSASSKAVCDL